MIVRFFLPCSPCLPKRWDIFLVGSPFLKIFFCSIPYLSADYVNNISQQPLPLSLITSLTSEQLQLPFQ